MPPLPNRLAFPVVLGIIAAASGCGPEAGGISTEPPVATPPVLAAAVVSEPLAPGLSGADETGVAYVSMPPGAHTEGREAVIRNSANGAQRVVPMIDGGWDPVSIAAEPGDTLRISIATGNNAKVDYIHVVPPSRPPMILRTDPPLRKRDVPLNASIVVVFSEPIDPARVNAERVKLLQDGQPVETGLVVSPDGLRVSVSPQARMEPETMYVLMISAELTDLGGQRLVEGAAVEFTTGMEAQPLSLAFVRGSSIMVANADGSQVELVQNGTQPSWSPDGTRIAFTRPQAETRGWQLCIARRDGDGIRCTTGKTYTYAQVAGAPSWSPDGATVAFSVYMQDCTDGICEATDLYFSSLLLLDTHTMAITAVQTPQVWSPTWSPDGRTIALALFGVGTYGRGALAMVNADGSGYRVLAESFGSYSVRHVAWAPDGSKLAVTLSDEHACPWYCDSAIGLVNADGTGLKVVARAYNSSQEWFWDPPAWSPGGAYLAYTISTGGGTCDWNFPCTDIRMINLKTGVSATILNSAALPAWRP